MEFIKTKFSSVYLVKPRVFLDNRGFFLESYSYQKFVEQGITAPFVQDNHSRSVQKNVLRGLHFQLPPFAQSKLIRVTRGAVYDVIADLRRGSPTYGKWQGFELSDENYMILYVPRGFAHGFCTLSENTEVQYKVDNPYSQKHDSGILWNDPDLAITWPCDQPILSDKDAKLATMRDFSSPFSFK